MEVNENLDKISDDYKVLNCEVTSHAVWNYGEEDTEFMKPGLLAVRYYNFRRTVEVGLVRIFPVPVRWAPVEPGQPSHIEIAYFNREEGRWITAADVKLPMYTDNKPHEIKLVNLKTDNMRIICDKEHPVPPSHGEMCENPDMVPFRVLDKVEFLGYKGSSAEIEPIYNPPLVKGEILPSPVKGMKVKSETQQVTYESPYFSVSFSLRRPIITHIGWDDMGSGLSRDNLSTVKAITVESDSFCGPFLRTLDQSVNPQFWTGEVEVRGNKVIYKGLKAIDNYSLDITFEVNERGMKMHLVKNCTEDFAALEEDDWRFTWDAHKCITGTLAMPVKGNARTGSVTLPAMWNAPGHGTVNVRYISGCPDISMQVDSFRERGISWAGISIGTRMDKYGTPINKKGRYEVFLDIETKPLAPAIRNDCPKDRITAGILRNWSDIFTFRPELGGYSNNSISCNCHLSQYHVADMLPFTAVPEGCPSVAGLMRYTIELALKGGPGYGDIRELYMDSDPSILISAGRVQQCEPDSAWVNMMWPFISESCIRIMKNIDESGLMVCRSLTGNSGSKKWSSNGWDVISFGHYDAYSNALGYRALLNTAGLALVACDTKMHDECLRKANKLKSAYRECFMNPETCRLAGWRSADGKLHDYAFTFINYMAVCYGLIEGDDAIGIIQNLEGIMDKAGLNYYHYGLPANLISVRSEDAPAGNDYKRSDGLDSFGIYVNGCLLTSWMNHYIRSLSMYGFNEKADLVCSQLEESFASDRLTGGLFAGTEFRTWEGRPCGYEGVLVGQFAVLGAIAQYRGLVDTPEPEWWL